MVPLCQHNQLHLPFSSSTIAPEQFEWGHSTNNATKRCGYFLYTVEPYTRYHPFSTFSLYIIPPHNTKSSMAQSLFPYSRYALIFFCERKLFTKTLNLDVMTMQSSHSAQEAATWNNVVANENPQVDDNNTTESEKDTQQ